MRTTNLRQPTLAHAADFGLGLNPVIRCVHHEAGMTLDQRGNVAVVGAHDHIAFPVA